MYDEIIKRAKHSPFPQNLSNNERNQNDAKQFDYERGLRTITKYFTFLKSEDPNTKKEEEILMVYSPYASNCPRPLL